MVVGFYDKGIQFTWSAGTSGLALERILYQQVCSGLTSIIVFQITSFPSSPVVCC